MTFADLGINDNIIQALDGNNINTPTEIQLQAIPHILSHTSDLVAVAQTGTGKTAAFSIPILQSIDPKFRDIQALVLVPTRELGQQVAREFFLFSKYLSRVFAEAVYGGAPIDDQIQKLKRPTHVVVATPGRLIDLLERKALNLDHLKYLVLDEADEMMNMGFKDGIDTIMESCNKNITKMLFTATMPADVKHIISKYLRPGFAEIHINAEEFINRNIEHSYLVYKQGEKLEYLKAFLSGHADERGIAFCRTKLDAKRLAKQLAGFTVSADALHGNLNQEMRDKVMRAFKRGSINLLVATDIAARGIDVKDLDYIVHYSLPEKTEQYTHRSGRTARAGKSGISVCLAKQDQMEDIHTLQSELNILFSPLSLQPKPEKPEPPITLHVNIGLGQGFTKNSLKEFLVEEAGLNTDDIQNVLVEDNRSRFSIPGQLEKQVLINLKGYKLAHRNLKFSRDGGKNNL